jgi:hypothetical protein
MDKGVRILIVLIILSIIIWGVARWYTLVIKGGYYSNASFLGSALVTLLPVAALLFLVWLAIKISTKPKY